MRNTYNAGTVALRLTVAALAVAAVLLSAAPGRAVGPIRGQSPPPTAGYTPSGAAGRPDPSPPTTRHESLMAQYKQAKGERLSSLAGAVAKPKAGMTSIRAQQIVDGHVEAALQYLHTLARDPKVQNELGKMRRREEVAAYVKRQIAQWEHLRNLARQALQLQVEMLQKREALVKAIKDSPEQISAFVEELRAAEDRIKDYLQQAGARIDQRKRERTVKFVVTVVGNVQSAWGNLLKAHQEFMAKKENQPETIKKSRDSIMGVANRPPKMQAPPEPEFSQAASQIATATDKGYKDYKKTYTDATAARHPLTTGQAAHQVTMFQGAKPKQLLSTAQSRLKGLPRPTQVPGAARPQ